MRPASLPLDMVNIFNYKHVDFSKAVSVRIHHIYYKYLEEEKRVSAILEKWPPDFPKEIKKEIYDTVLDRSISTLVTVLFEDNLFVVGMANCSYGDQFSRKYGRNLALERALSNGYVPRRNQ